MALSLSLGVAYLMGGLTFLPLICLLILLHAYLTLPSKCKTDDNNYPSSAEQLKLTPHALDVAAGYFAVCREYVPGGINGKPPERITPTGTVAGIESPSVYQAMYKSIFDRNRYTAPSIDVGSGTSKRGRNVFYVVLRHGHLMLYDDAEELEVRHVISLAHYHLDIYSGGEAVPEGELYIKRNCIRLSQRIPVRTTPSDLKPFYFFSDNCSDKEDFYHAMLQSQQNNADSVGTPSSPLKFSTPDLVKLVQQLHASEDNLHTRWINALIGRLFLSLYKIPEVEEYIWTKITKKIARVNKPKLISSIRVQKVDMGTLPPFITNPKLRGLSVDGDLTIEADITYKGNFRLEISAIARIDLGSRIKPREVTLVLASILKSLEGHILIRIKAPPSNRIWVTFESTPKMEFALEPIVSTRQITYGVILRAIESRIREVVSETLVFPNWDDIPFFDTTKQKVRGGLWAENSGDAG
ncbi:putative integral membrane protein conserved region-domain-containing protein, partial [Massariosphaeria phaeospora]